MTVRREHDILSVLLAFNKIVGHQGPLAKIHPEYKGDIYNVIILWSNGETTTEPLSIIAKDDFFSCAMYAQENGLLHTDGWKCFRSAAKRAGRYLRAIKIYAFTLFLMSNMMADARLV